MLTKIWSLIKLNEIWTWVKTKIKSFSLREWFLIAFSICVSIAAIQIYFTDRTKIVTIQADADSLRNSANEQYKAKTVLIQTVSELKKRNDSISTEYQKIKDQDPLVITNTQIQTKIDSVSVPTYVYSPSPNKYVFAWDYAEATNDENYFNISGQTTTDSLMDSASTLIKKMELGMNLKLDVVKSEAQNAFRIIARSDNPRVSITNIEGAVINPTENKTIKSYFPTKHWGLGIHAGIGAQYGINNKSFSFGPEIGIGISYNILTW